jgi:hypothetical protein
MMFLSVFHDSWPSLGLTPEVLDQLYPERGSGLWQREPHRAIGMGCAYFAMTGLFSILFSWRRESGPAKRRNEIPLPVLLLGALLLDGLAAA